MPLFEVNRDKCNKDGICAAECPLKIIDMKATGWPVPIPGADALCINCGHCVAVCPTGALSHRLLKPEACLPVNRQWLLSPEQAEHFLRYRRSIRNYKKQPVDRAVIERLIRVARCAPTGHNRQPVKWQVIYRAEDVRRLSGLVIEWMRFMVEKHPRLAGAMHLDLVVAAWEFGVDTVSRGAPHLVLANADVSDISAQSACTIAMTYFDLAAAAFGLGTCWNGFFNAAAMQWQPLKDALGLTAGEANFGAMMLGYPKFTYHRMPDRKEPEIKWT
ncbi:MAG: nitroreductase family protein [Thermodesulfobacteriota bacterium]